MICKICNEEVECLSKHLRSHKILTKEYYDKYIKQENEGICLYCGKETRFIGLMYGYRKHCSNKCAQLDSITRNKAKITCLNKYSAENVYASEYGKNKIKQSCLKHFGTEYALQSNVVKEKIQQTNIKRYGVKNPQQNREIKEKTINTNLIKYGNACAVYNPDIWNKAVNTMKKNGHYSKLELYLEEYFIRNNVNYKSNYKSNYSQDVRYPFHCDFYLPDKDLFIEINNYWHHNNHFFNNTSIDDQNTLNIWKEKSKTKPQYSVAIDVWIIRDIEKLNCAIKNKLNYIVLWNKQDIYNFIHDFTK